MIISLFDPELECLLSIELGLMFLPFLLSSFGLFLVILFELVYYFVVVLDLA